MGMKMYLEENVFDAALKRIHRLFDEFYPNIVVNMSGGKDSTIIMQLCLIVAEQRGVLPIKVVFLDQEAEWDATIDYIRSLQNDPRIDFDWLQVPFKIFNASSYKEPWLQCWQEGGNWLREKEAGSIQVNDFGTDRFVELLDYYMYKALPKGGISIAGVRAQESPARAKGLTNYATYKDITWGSKRRKNYYVFYPIYDWEISDVWKAIHDNGWAYNRLYDYMYQYGVPLLQMRVSNINHETALHSLMYLQEIEPENWEKITARMLGINTVGQMQQQFYAPKTLPFMFSSWLEYRDYLLENLIEDTEIRGKMTRQFASSLKMFLPHPLKDANCGNSRK